MIVLQYWFDFCHTSKWITFILTSTILSMFHPPPAPIITLATNLFSSSIIPSLGGYCVSRIYSMCPFEMAFVTQLHAVSSVMWSAVPMGWSMMPSSERSIKSTTPVHQSSTAHTLLKMIGTSLRRMQPETQACGVVGVFVMILGVTWFLCGLPHHDLILSLLPLLGVKHVFLPFCSWRSSEPWSSITQQEAAGVGCSLGPLVFCSQPDKSHPQSVLKAVYFICFRSPITGLWGPYWRGAFSPLPAPDTGTLHNQAYCPAWVSSWAEPLAWRGADGLPVRPRSTALRWTTSLWMSVSLCCGAARTRWPSPSSR